VQISWLDPERLDSRDVSGAVALLEAARLVDCPHEPGDTVSSFTAGLRHGWDGDAPVTGLTRDGLGRVTGVLTITFPHWDNTHLSAVEIAVDPVVRRQGLGRRLFDTAVDRTRAEGRTLIVVDGFDQPPAMAFATAMGLDRGSRDVQRSQDVRTLDWARLDHEYAVAERRASGYELVRLPDATPEAMVADVARLTEAINDAPTDDLDVQDEVFSPERIRAFEAAQRASRRRMYRLLARERGTGVLAGQTVVAVESERPWFGSQYDTSVRRSHRGHRLGLLLKIGMLRWLGADEPQLRRLDTWNAASNTHMIAVNEVLGYRVVANGVTWQRHLEVEQPARPANRFWQRHLEVARPAGRFTSRNC